MKKLTIAIAFLASSLGVLAEQNTSKFSFMVVADTAYKVPHDYRNYDKLIAQMNSEQPEFTIHLGDLFSGHTDCGDTNIARARTDLNKYHHPVVYTPGDNEWTDCHSERAGGYDPLERLDNIRSLFYRNTSGLKQQSLSVVSQGAEGLIENQRWQHGSVLFATAHIVGSNNGLRLDAAESLKEEYEARNKANLAWIQHVFERAEEDDVQALVLAYHANIFGDADQPDGFKDIRPMLLEMGERLQKPVLLVHGDHHQFVVDRPYLPPLAEGPGASITRLQTYGWPDAKAVKVTIDTSRPDMFEFKPVFAGKGIY